jgi:4-diphosphocytidyl-2-C-methyl-D-erythritol kinase
MPLYRSPAKINPHLQVVCRRADGHHELKVLFQTIDFHDLLEVEIGGEGIDLSVRGSDVAAGPENLAFRAAERFLEIWPGPRGVAIRLDKRIPVGGGLGGGSSNAATVLLALRELTGRPASVAELWPVARSLGADVPYFLLGGLVVGLGRGDELIPLADAEEEDLLLVVPSSSVSTRAVFERFSAGPRAAAAPPGDWPAGLSRWVLDAGEAGEAGEAGSAPRSLGQIDGRNDLEAGVLESYPEVRRVYTALHQQGVERVRMTGSGACGFAVWPRGREVPAALSAICRVEVVRTLSRRSLESFRRAS